MGGADVAGPDEAGDARMTWEWALLAVLVAGWLAAIRPLAWHFVTDVHAGTLEHVRREDYIFGFILGVLAGWLWPLWACVYAVNHYNSIGSAFWTTMQFLTVPARERRRLRVAELEENIARLEREQKRLEGGRDDGLDPISTWPDVTMR